jgi:hypothetical protein
VNAIANAVVRRCGGLCTTEEVDEMKARNEHRLNSYKAVMDRLGRVSSKYVLPLRHDSSDLNEIAAVALRQLVGDLPDECLPGDECAVHHACGSAESCHDTPYGPKRCSGCAPGKAPHPTGGEWYLTSSIGLMEEPYWLLSCACMCSFVQSDRGLHT